MQMKLDSPEAEGAARRHEVEDRVRCHLCGRWQRSLGAHAFYGHNMTAAV